MTTTFAKTIVFTSTAIVALLFGARATADVLEDTAYADLVLAATLPAPGDARAACFLLPDGSYFTAVKNQRIGTKHAYISRVNSTSIEVTELMSVNRGEWAVNRFFWPVTSNVPVEPGRCPAAGVPLPSPEAAVDTPPVTGTPKGGQTSR